ncbi:unnamed protein product [Brassica oleracea var. botrytis]|uniref:Uncharacterized protein n=1 Tax=Brassica oleracea TaxID=3712 RepID=A0A3P6D7K6_BRAOL|nr:unnamed protein product [Brassica oleracea]
MDTIDSCWLMAPELARGNLEPNHGSVTRPSIKSPLSFHLSSYNEHYEDCSDVVTSSDLSTISITSSKTSQATLGSYPCPLFFSLRHCVFHQTSNTTTRPATSQEQVCRMQQRLYTTSGY